MAGEWQFEWRENWDDLTNGSTGAQLAAWVAEGVACHVFFHPTLLKAWLATRTFAPTAQVLFARHGKTELVWPLALIRIPWLHGPGRVLVPAGYPDYDYHDPWVKGPMPPDLWASFWESLDKALTVRGINRRQRVFMNLHREVAPTGARPVAVCPRLEFARLKGGESLLSRLPSRLRGDIGRQRRRLERLGALRFDVIAPGSGTASRILTRLESLHRKKWPFSPDRSRLHAALLHEDSNGEVVHFSALWLNEAPISLHLGFYDARSFYWYLPVYDPAYAPYSPGKLHLYECAEWAYARGLPSLDLLRGQESYKAAWANDANRLVELTPTLRGLILSRQLDGGHGVARTGT